LKYNFREKYAVAINGPTILKIMNVASFITIVISMDPHYFFLMPISKPRDPPIKAPIVPMLVAITIPLMPFKRAIASRITIPAIPATTIIVLLFEMKPSM